MQRMKQKLNKSNDKEMTPSKHTEHMMTEADLSEEQKAKLRKTLLTGTALMKELSDTRKKTPKGKMAALHKIVSGRIVRKYRCVKTLATETGLCRHKLAKSESKEHQIKRAVRTSRLKRQRNRIIEFLQREDNSRTLPGKQDATRLKKGLKVQSHVLTDYLSNLHLKYKAENPDTNISLASFCRTRPSYILKTAFTSRLSCLCTKHQNAALTLKVMKKAGVEVSANPEKAIDNIPKAEILMKELNPTVNLSQWKRVEIEDRGKKKYVTRIVEVNMEKEVYVQHVGNQMKEFQDHVNRMKTQFEQMKTLKSNLPEHDMIVQIDFAENYSCRSLMEVQSAYFNQTSVTLHPMVVYYRPVSGEITHKSFVTISDEVSHKAATVVSFLDDVMPELFKIDHNLKTIHYWSDSPSSQYRNKQIFHFIENHKKVYGVHAVWNYWESGHGKSPCDGLGGSCKRLADEYIRSGKAVIQDANDFFDWAISSNMKNVTFRFVKSEVCQQKDIELNQNQVKPVKGTMKLHAVVGLDKGILTRETSCYCKMCLEGEYCESWQHTTTIPVEKVNNIQSDAKETEQSTDVQTANTVDGNSENPIPDINLSESNNIGVHATKDSIQSYKNGDFVVALYDNNHFIEQIVDEDEHEFEINFMEERKGLFQWPRNNDILWLSKCDVLYQIDHPIPTGKSARMFKFSADIILKFKSKN